MQFNEKEGYYYEFSLDIDFVPSAITDNYVKRTLAAQHTHNKLGQFISDNIVKKGLHFSSDRIFLIAENEKERTKVKDFCHFLMESGTLLNIATNNIITKFSLDNFQVDLTRAYEKFKLNKSLLEELIDKPINNKKSSKV
jgi:hypothetical protein